jgi:hypothetical protein
MTMDTLRDILEALPVGADVQLIADKDEFGRRVTHVRTGSRTVTLDDDHGLRIGVPQPLRRAL